MLVDAIHYAVERLGFAEIKSLQLKVVLALATEQDVFGVLPTGYGKSLCYACLPILFCFARTSATNVKRWWQMFRQGSAFRVEGR